jgi:oxalate---CoA ligase
VDEAVKSQLVPARSKVNVSQLRRENELVRVIELCGGMANTHTKEFFEVHMNLVEAMSQAGEPTSAPIGTRLDKRTAETTLNSMATRGRIKMLKTSLLTSTGATRPVSIVYLPSIEQDTLNSFLVDLGRSYSSQVAHFSPVTRIDEPLNYGSTVQVQRAALPLQLLQTEDRGVDDKERWSRNAARAAQLFTFDDATIREVLLAERTTLGQLYGFIVGKAMRARFLHLTTLGFFDRQVSSPRIISLEHRIVDLSFFYHDLQLSSFCALIGSLVHGDELDQFFQTLEGKDTPVEKIPASLHTTLQVGRARTRSRFLDLLEFLRSLGLVTPLRPSDSNNPQYISAPNGDHPTAFDLASLEGWSITASFNAPTYWRFNKLAPLHFWSQSAISPPFWKDMPIVSFHDAVAYWHDLDQACRNRDLPQRTPGPSVGSTTESATGPSSPSIGVARSLRRQVSWNGSYTLTWHQEQYLQRFVDRTTGDTPMQDEDAGEAQLQKISWVVSAPRDVVEKYLGKARKKIIKELDKVRRKTKRQVADEEAKKAVEAKALLQRKAAEAKLQREKDWGEMLLRVHPEPLKSSATVRMRRVRSRFLQSSSGRDTQKWEGEITQAIREVKMAQEALPKTRPLLSPVPVPDCVAPPLIVTNHPEKSIDTLIAQQGPSRAVKELTKRKGRGKGQDIQGKLIQFCLCSLRQDFTIMEEGLGEVQPKPLARRGRFQWNRDFDELARDASVIIRARCRDGPRIDWAALEQVFPAVPRNSVRQRIVALKEIPGADAYLKRLEDRWYDLWSQHRGTENLADDDPQSPSKFDLIRHIEFLRKHIDKNAMYVFMPYHCCFGSPT